MWKCGRVVRRMTATVQPNRHWSLMTRALTAAAIEQGMLEHVARLFCCVVIHSMC